MELEEWLNEDGVNPTKLTKQELVNEITFIGDFATMGDCIRYLYEIDKKLATDSLLKVMTTDKENENYGDRFYQAMFLGSLFINDEDSAITYTANNYSQMVVYVLAQAISSLTHVDGNKFEDLRNELKQYIEEKGEDYFKELEEDIATKDIIKEFLDSFK